MVCGGSCFIGMVCGLCMVWRVCECGVYVVACGVLVFVECMSAELHSRSLKLHGFAYCFLCVCLFQCLLNYVDIGVLVCLRICMFISDSCFPYGLRVSVL